jgi:hypothetical protein
LLSTRKLYPINTSIKSKKPGFKLKGLSLLELQQVREVSSGFRSVELGKRRRKENI